MSPICVELLGKVMVLSSIELLGTINSNNANHEYVEINSASNVGGSHTIIARSALDCELRNQRQLLLSVEHRKLHEIER